LGREYAGRLRFGRAFFSYVRNDHTLIGPAFQGFEQRRSRHLPTSRALVSRRFLIKWNERDEIIAIHEIKPALLQSSIVTAMMTHLVKDSSPEQIPGGQRRLPTRDPDFVEVRIWLASLHRLPHDAMLIRKWVVPLPI